MKFLRSVKSLLLLTSLTFFHTTGSASTSLTVSGHAGAVGQYLSGIPPLSTSYTGFQVPVGLIFQVNPVDSFSLFLELDYAYTNYPVPQILLGQTSDTTQVNADGNAIPMPFANSINWGGTSQLPFGQKIDSIQVVQAYFAFQTPFGLFRAGRMPRNWGLGIWYDSHWSAEGSGISTTDALAFTTDFGLYSATFYYEKFGQSIGGIFNTGSATQYTIEGRLKTSPIDLASSGVSRDIGIIYSYFTHQQSDTSLNTIDLYGKFYFPRFFAGGELLFPTGKTKNPNYQTLGGAPKCAFPDSVNNTCSSQNISSLGALLKLRTRFDAPTQNSTLYAIEKSHELLGTRDRQNSHTGELWVGYASGGKNQFSSPQQINPGSNKITGIRLNPNIMPSLMMFTNTLPLIDGMPTASITNSTFVRLDYTYESNKFGSFTPAVVWGMINATNGNFNASNPTCTGSPTLDYSSAINNFCVGGSRNLGTEFNLTYKYTTQHLITAQLDVGYWLVGNAWQKFDKKLAYNTIGVRGVLSTQF